MEMRPGKNGGMLRSGGPGRPKGSVNLTNQLKKFLEEHENQKAQELVEAWFKQALENPSALKLVLDRIDGPVPSVIVQEAPQTLEEIDRELNAITDAARAREGAGTPSQETGTDDE
jgi:hypothetical protein